MTIDFETARYAFSLMIALVLVPFATVMWFLMRKMLADQIKLETALMDHKLDVASNYIRRPEFDKAVMDQKDDFNRAVDAIFKKLDRIESWVNRNGTSNHD